MKIPIILLGPSLISIRLFSSELLLSLNLKVNYTVKNINFHSINFETT